MMDMTADRGSRTLEVLGGVALALGCGVLLGVASLWLSPMWTLAALGCGALAVVGLWRSEFLVLVYLVLTSSVIHVTRALSFSIGIGTVYATDAVLLLSFALIVLRLHMERDFKPVHTPLDLPLLIFWGAAIVATVLAIFGSSLAFKQSLGETRVVTSYLLFFVVTQLVRDKAQLVRLTKGFFIIAGVVALATIAQYALGDSQIIIAGRVGALWTEGQTYSDVARVIPPGQSVLVVAFIAVFATLMTERVQFRQARRFVMLGVLGLAILLTFFRASWGVIALTVLLAGLLAGGEEKRRFVSWVLLGMVALGVIVGMIMLQPQSPGAGLVRATFNRLSTLVEPATFQDPQSSLRWRDFEYAYALPHIYANPFIGLGMGALYRPLTPQDWENFDGRTFVHNGHIYILLKVGLFGYVASMWFILGVLVRGLRSWRRIADPYMRGIVLAFSLTSLVVLLVSMVEPYVVTTGWTPVIGTIAGINEVAIRIASRAEES